MMASGINTQKVHKCKQSETKLLDAYLRRGYKMLLTFD